MPHNTPLQMQGNPRVYNNNRGLSLLSIAGKVLARIVLNRMLKEAVDSIYPKIKFGFRAGRGTVEADAREIQRAKP